MNLTTVYTATPHDKGNSNLRIKSDTLDYGQSPLLRTDYTYRAHVTGTFN